MPCLKLKNLNFSSKILYSGKMASLNMPSERKTTRDWQGIDSLHYNFILFVFAYSGTACILPFP